MANNDGKEIQPGLQESGNADVVKPTATGDQSNTNQLRTDLRAIAELFRKDPSPWVNGTAIAFLPNGQTAETPRVVVFVDPSAPKCETDAIQERVQPNAQVLRVGRFIGLQSPTPASSGDSAGTYAPFRYQLPPVNTGTLGARVLSSKGQEYVLGSNHVLAHNGRARAGTPITVPGAIDDITAGRVIAGRSQFVSLQPAVWPYLWPSQGAFNSVDCALAEVAHPGAVNAPTEVKVFPNPSIASLTAADLTVLSQAKVNKKGRATGQTNSQIRIFDLATHIGFSFGTYYFQRLIGTFDKDHKIFAAPGDSGSLAIIDPSAPPNFGSRAIGIITARAYVFDSSDQFFAYIIAMCPMDSVAAELENEMKLNPGDLKFFMS